jgi:hypothetical protein
MNKRVLLISFLVAVGIFLISMLFMVYKIDNNTMFTDGTGYALFDITKIELQKPTYANVMANGYTTHTLYGAPFWFFYKTTGELSSSYISILPLTIDFLMFFGISLLVIYSIYKSKYKQMLGFKEENKKPYPEYNPLWSFVEPDYYNITPYDRYNMTQRYNRKNKKGAKK